MKEMKEALDAIREGIPKDYDDFPDIELYMDQVTAYLARQKVSLRDGDKLTSAMVNNYIKDGLLPRASGKKYSREHLIYLTLIMRLKQVLSVKDTATLLHSELTDVMPDEYYEKFREKLDAAFAGVEGRINKSLSGQDVSEAALTLALDSYVSKIACEYLLDRLLPEQPADKSSRKKKQ